MLLKLNDDSSTNDLWIWLADAYRYINSGCSMDALENVINRSLSNGFWGAWFWQNCMLGDSILTSLNKMKQMDHQQHSDGLLQEFYAMTQKHNESIGKYAVRCNIAASQIWLQSQEALGNTTLAYAKARNFNIRPMMELSDCFMNLRLAVRFKTTLFSYVEYNLQIPGISSYNSDRVALVAEDNTEFSKEVPLTICTKTEDTILEALKEGEIEMLDSV